jgi:hypothetical protein
MCMCVAIASFELLLYRWGIFSPAAWRGRVVTSLSLAQITRGYMDPCSIRRVHNPDDADADANADDCATTISIVFRDDSGSISEDIWSWRLLLCCDRIRAQLVSQKVLVLGRVMNSSTCLSIG